MMGKHFGFGVHKETERSEPPTPSGNSKHQHHQPHQTHSTGALHAALPQRSTLISPCGRPPRYSGDSDADDQFLIPSAVAGRLQQQSSQQLVGAPATANPSPAPTLGPGSSTQLYGADTNQHQYSRLAGKMISMVNELRATGADVALELPTIVVCGQQSAGKSSVVEAICGIPLPRNTETCTRCPTEVRLSQPPPSSGATWEAVVKLRRENSGTGPSVRASAAWQLQQNLPQQQSSTNGYSHLASGVGSPQYSVNSTPAGSRQPSMVAAQNSTISSGGAGGYLLDATDVAALSLETLFRAGITSPADLPGAVAAAQTALLSQSRYSNHGSSNEGRRLSSQQSLGRGANAAGNAAADSAAGLQGGSPVGAAAAAAVSSSPLKFSRDVVVVEVRGAPVDLTLIDLPGIIYNLERPEDDHYKHLVADLTTSYLQRPATVIIPVITAKEDIENQVVLSMAREADPEGTRTLGVLTKPDMVEEGCHNQWLKVLAGDKYPLALGWYVVRNPNQAALMRGTSSAMARQQEEAFFNSTYPWNRLPGNTKERLGTLKLREAMSKQLVKMVTTARPALMAAAQVQLIALRADLASMPPAAVLGDGHAEMLRLIDDVSMSIQEEVLARSKSKQFYQHLLNNFQQLKSELAASRPCFLLPRGNSSSSSCCYLVVTCALDDDLAAAEDARQQQQQLILGGAGSISSRQDAPATPNGNAKAQVWSFDIFNNTGSSGSGLTVDSSGKPGLGVCIGGSAAAGNQAAMVLAACPHQVLLPSDGPEAGRGMTLEDVRQLVERHHSIELPGFSPYSAVQDLVARHQQGWPAAVTECAAAAHRQLLQLVMLHVGKTFDRFPRAADHIRELATELLEELHTETSSAVESLVAMELAGAFAVCRREFSRASNQHLEGLRTLISAASTNSALLAGSNGSSNSAITPAGDGSSGADASKAGSYFAADGGSRKRLSEAASSAAAAGIALPQTAGLYEPPTLLAPIPATATGPGELLSMMAVVLTYFGISCRRLADTVSMSIMHHLISSFNSKFRARLAAQLLSLTTEAVAGLLVEDAACAARRAALKQKKDLLEQAMRLMRAAG